jgi:type I restriction enzyme S subunit
MKWVSDTLGDICRKGGGRIQTGPFGSQLHQSDYSAEGTPVVMPADLIDGKIDISRIARVSETHVERLRRHKLSKGDIVYGRRGDIGRQAFVTGENVGWLCGTGCLKISLGKGPLADEYLHRYLSTSSVVGWIKGQAIGATMPNLNTGILERIPILYPQEIKNQKKIAAILSAYDDLIENNKRRIALLEKMAEEIYREWFVRFRFPGHEKVKFVKGLPEGWKTKKLGDILELCYGKALKQNDRLPGEYYVFGSGGIVGTHSKALVKEPGLIVGRKGNVGSVYLSDRGFFPIDTVYYVKSELSIHYLFYLLQTMNFINNDAAVPGLNRKQAYSNCFLMPPTTLIDEFAKIVNNNFSLKQNLISQNEFLMKTRDMLLPRLISGKLSVENLDIQFPPSMQPQEET